MKLFRKFSHLSFLMIFLFVTPAFAETLLLNASYEINSKYSGVALSGCKNVVECISSDGKGNVSVKPSKTEGNIYYHYFSWIKTGVGHYLPHDISVTEVKACIKAQRTWVGSGSTACFVFVLENSSSIWIESNERFTCEKYPYWSYGTYCTEATDFFNLTKLNFSGIGWGIRYKSLSHNDYRNLILDWFYLNISYVPLLFLYWKTNTTLLHRGESAEIASKWQIKDIALAKTEHNFSGSFDEYKLAASKEGENSYWVNFTVTFANSANSALQQDSNSFFLSAPGYYEISYIYVQDSYGGYNQTFPKLGLALYGFAKISEINVNDSYVYPTESVLASCRVIDANTSEPIKGYNVSFYRNGSFVGNSLTNASGIASLIIPIPDQEGVFEIKCGISDSPELYYNASEEREKRISVVSKNLSLTLNLSKKVLDFGDTLIVRINITNSSKIEKIELNEDFFEINSSCVLEKTETNRTLTVGKCYFPNLCEASAAFPVYRASWHNLSVSVFANSPFGIGKNSSRFFVNFGRARAYFKIPYYFVLGKQNFSIIASVSAVSGDVWNVSVNLTIDGQESMNITKNETFEKKFAIQAVKPGLECKVAWNAFSNATGLVRMGIAATPLNGSGASYSESFEVIEPKVKAPPNISFSDSSIFIDEYTLIKANVIGNATPCTVNFSVLKPYNSGNESFGFDFIEAKNVTECGIELETGNIASLNKSAYANASYNQEDASLAIDENNVTYWSWGGASVFNVTFRKPDYTVAKIEILWKKLVLAEVNATIKYLSPTGAVKTFRANVPLTEKKNTSVFADFRPFKAGKLIINLTGGASIYEIRVYPTTPRLDKCYVFVKNFTSQNFTRSGFYSVSATVLTQSESAINLKNSSFFVRFGIPLLEISQETPSSMLTNTSEKYILKIKAFRGDLRNLTLNFTSTNATCLALDESEQSNKTVAFLGWNNQTEVFWRVKALALPQGYSNFTVLTYVNATSVFATENRSIEFNITVYPEDTQPPVINEFWFEIFGVKTNKTNINFALSIVANVTDNIWVREVNATVIYPSNYNVSAKMRRNGNLWNFTFSLDDLTLNETGNYSIRIEAIDINYTKTVSNFSQLNVSNRLILVVESPTLLNRGEFLNVSARDINNITLPLKIWFYFKANLSNANYTISLTNFSRFFTYFINPSQPTGKYESVINASIYNNSAELAFEFEVSSDLIITVVAPSPGTAFEPGSAISGVDLPRIKVYNVRGDRELMNVNASVRCFNSTHNYQEHDISYGACGIFPTAISFADCVSRCYAPNSYGSVFNIYFFAKDAWNNSGSYSLPLKTISLTPQQPPSAPGGGGGGGAGYVPPVCNCTEWKNVGCGLGPCKEEEMYQERVCTPENCSIEWRCIKHEKCKKRISFEIDYTNTTLKAVKGFNHSVFVFVSNTGEKDINASVKAGMENCGVFFEKFLFLETGNVKVLEFVIYCPLNASSENDVLSFEISAGNVTKEGAVNVKIEENPKVKEFAVLKKKWKKLKEIIAELEKSGVEDEVLKNLKASAERALEEGEKSIRTDSLQLLTKSAGELEKLASMAEKRINSHEVLLEKIIAIAKANIHWITLGILVFVYLSYLIFGVLVPYLKISKRISLLKSQERDLIKARIETQKQFFMRKIDEKTFREMITKTQREILTIRAKIRNLALEKEFLAKKAWNPLLAIKWLRSVFSKIPKVIYRVAERIKEYGTLVYWRIRFR